MFQEICNEIEQAFKEKSYEVNHNKWQSIEVAHNPAMKHQELLNYSIHFPLTTEHLDYYREEIKPNLPWADDHFDLERVSGEPINPGHQWKNWPYSKSAAQHVDKQFSHSYAERYWPKYAGKTIGGRIQYAKNIEPLKGIRFEYGDLEDLVRLLIEDPLTRQAFLPIWFPEDLAAIKSNQRVPCSLGYHFIIRNDQLHVVYYIRSCDYIRHFRDDVYLTIRLLFWIYERIKADHPYFTLGTFTMHITSFHMFVSDYKILCKD